ncbi:MAG: gamma-glutamyl-gamma-aminobutyrate hydrolase family protein [Bacteroidetes bacterium]|nr:gamma-glutamyl-gamma-aminobutyrate hydrolase family protein [Bacteroidota bacterium]
MNKVIKLLAISLLISYQLNIENVMGQTKEKVKVAFSKAGPEEKYKLYTRLFLTEDPGIECVDMSGLSPAGAVGLLEGCSGLVLTGGNDVDPNLYQKKDQTGRCGVIDYTRDTLEIALIKKALEKGMPVFAICRGAQLLNVVEGGSLFIDIPGDLPNAVIHRNDQPEGASHDIELVPGSWLNTVVKSGRGQVNSYHHQGVERLAGPFTPWARAADGLIEAYGWKNPENKSLLIAVQWHPERMTANKLFSGLLAKKWIEAVYIYGVKK